MDVVNIDKDTLLKIVLENREKHIAAFKEAVKDFQMAVIKISNENIEIVNAGKLDIKMLPPKPTSYESNYTKAIRMLELSVDSVVELDQYEFAKLVQDEWDWKQIFDTSNATYKSMTGR